MIITLDRLRALGYRMAIAVVVIAIVVVLVWLDQVLNHFNSFP